MPSIAIIGAGPAGLTLARLLLVQVRKQNIKDLKITIFENDASAKARWLQGGTLDLHTTTGIAALKAAEMWDDILPHMRYDGEELIFADMHATKFLHISSAKEATVGVPGEHERPEIDREILKDSLLKSVEDIAGDKAVTWGKHLTSVDAAAGILKFRDGSEAGPFDLVIGADGAWSKIRTVVTDVKPSYSGITGFECWVDEEHSNGRWDEFVALVGKGSFFSYSKRKSVMMQRMEDGGLKLSMWKMTPDEHWAADLTERCGGDEDKLRTALLQEFSDWDESYKAFMRSGFHFRAWPLFELPVGHSWEHKKGYTLIGDASHLMTPFAGEGVNAAMKDCLDLSDRIISALLGKMTLDEAVQKFEQDMFPRNTTVQGKTARNKRLMFREDAPIGVMAGIPEIFAEEFGYDVNSWTISVALAPVKGIAYLYFSCVSWVGWFKRCIRRT